MNCKMNKMEDWNIMIMMSKKRELQMDQTQKNQLKTK